MFSKGLQTSLIIKDSCFIDVHKCRGITVWITSYQQLLLPHHGYTNALGWFVIKKWSRSMVVSIVIDKRETSTLNILHLSSIKINYVPTYGDILSSHGKIVDISSRRTIPIPAIWGGIVLFMSTLSRKRVKIANAEYSCSIVYFQYMSILRSGSVNVTSVEYFCSE